jgi:hypothetical protein
MTQVRSRRTLKNFVSSSHQVSGFSPNAAIRAYIDPQHIAKPEILTNALMDHLLSYAASSGVIGPGAHREVVVREFAPDADHLDAFRFIGFYQEVVFHYSHLINS